MLLDHDPANHLSHAVGVRHPESAEHVVVSLISPKGRQVWGEHVKQPTCPSVK
jgi:hypothetical protein